MPEQKISVVERFKPQGIILEIRKSALPDYDQSLDPRPEVTSTGLVLSPDEAQALYMELHASLQALRVEREQWPSG